jgi:chloramphenicol O-acetyltransferase type B
MNFFENYRNSITIKDHIKSKHISVGDYTYYAGFYHGKIGDRSFEDCVMYLDEKDEKRKSEEIDKLIIGKFCSIATGVKFMMGGNQGHNYKWITAFPLDFLDDDFDNYEIPPKGYKLKGDTIIGSDVWIGAETMIMPGITIGDGAVIAARSLVTKNIGSYEIWGGNPAKLIKKRFDDDKIEKLLKMKWWDWDLSNIKKCLHIIRSEDVDELYKIYCDNFVSTGID